MIRQFVDSVDTLSSVLKFRFKYKILNLLVYFDIIKLKRKEYLSSQWIISSEPVFNHAGCFLFKLVSFTWNNVAYYHSFMVLVLSWDIAKWHDITFRYLCGWPNFACSYKRNARWRFSDNPIIQRYKSFENNEFFFWELNCLEVWI